VGDRLGVPSRQRLEQQHLDQLVVEQSVAACAQQTLAHPRPMAEMAGRRRGRCLERREQRRAGPGILQTWRAGHPNCPAIFAATV